MSTTSPSRPGRGEAVRAHLAPGLRKLLGWHLGVAAVALLASLGGQLDPSAGEPLPEYKIKAAFLYNFIRYTTWPEDAFADKAAPIELLVVGKDPFGQLLVSTFEGKELHGRRVEVQRSLKLPPEPTAHLVFCALSEERARHELLLACDERPVLVIGEDDGFAVGGASANFYIKDKKVRFEINPGAVKRNRLEISSQLLKLAKLVKTKEAR